MNTVLLAGAIFAALETRAVAAIAASHAIDAGARQPEVLGKIQTMLLASIVFIESLCIYTLVVALLLIFMFR